MNIGFCELGSDTDLDVVVTRYNNLMDYEKEIFLSHNFLLKLNKICKENKIYFIKLKTDLYGNQNDSIMVIDNGVILGIFEEVNLYDKYINIIQTKYGRFALLINNDIYIDGIENHLKTIGVDYVVASVEDYMYVNDLIYKSLNFKTFIITQTQYLWFDSN